MSLLSTDAWRWLASIGHINPGLNDAQTIPNVLLGYWPPVPGGTLSIDLPPVRPRSWHFASLSLSFLLCETGSWLLLHNTFGRIKGDEEKFWAQCLAGSKALPSCLQMVISPASGLGPRLWVRKPHLSEPPKCTWEVWQRVYHWFVNLFLMEITQ